MPYLTPQNRATREYLRREFATRLTRALHAAALTQSELAQLSGISQPNVSAMMNGKLGASPERVAALAKALRMEPDELMPEVDPNAPLPAVTGTGNPAPSPTTGRRRTGGAVLSEMMPQPGSPWILRSISDNRVELSESLVRHLRKHRETITLEMAEMLADLEAVTIRGVEKDEEFWERRQGDLQRELSRRDPGPGETAREPSAEEEAAPEEGAGRGRRRAGAPVVQKRAARS